MQQTDFAGQCMIRVKIRTLDNTPRFAGYPGVKWILVADPSEAYVYSNPETAKKKLEWIAGDLGTAVSDLCVVPATNESEETAHV